MRDLWRIVPPHGKGRVRDGRPARRDNPADESVDKFVDELPSPVILFSCHESSTGHRFHPQGVDYGTTMVRLRRLIAGARSQAVGKVGAGA